MKGPDIAEGQVSFWDWDYIDVWEIRMKHPDSSGTEVQYLRPFCT